MKNCLDVTFVFLKRFAINENIIKIYNAEFIDVEMQNLVYPPLASNG